MKKHYSRKKMRLFLNTDGGIALLSMHAVVPRPYHEDDDGYPNGYDGSLTLGDCGRQITLDFDAFDEKDVKERLRKIDRIRAALDVLEDGLLDHYMVSCPTKAERKQVRVARKEEGENRVRLVDL